MAITNYKELPRSGSPGVESTRTFIFWVDNPQRTTERDIYNDRRCPKVGSRHPDRGFSLFFLKKENLSIVCGTGNERNKWTVTAKYTKLEPGDEEPEEQPDAEDAETELPDFSPHVFVDFEEYSAPMTLSLAVPLEESANPTFGASKPAGFGAHPLVTSALEPYENPPEIIKENTIIRVTRNLGIRSALWADAMRLKNTKNTDSFTYRRGTLVVPVKPGQCRVKIRIGDEQEYRTKTGKTKLYANLEVQFKIKEDTWHVDLLDTGSKYLSEQGKTIADRIQSGDWGLPDGVKQLPIKDAEDNNTLGLLDGKGTLTKQGNDASFNRWPGYVNEAHGGFFKRLTRKPPKKKKG